MSVPITDKELTITLLGNNSGRNLGDAAILSSILEHLKRLAPNATSLVPTINPKWIMKHYGSQYRVKAINVMPWTGSIRLLGIPTLIAIAKSDAALICDGIIFGKKILNPAFNYLITLLFLAPWARLWGCKLVCFSCGIGPFPSDFSKWCAKIVLKYSDIITMRDPLSINWCKELQAPGEIHHTGDVAFINPVSSREVGEKLLKDAGIDPDRPIFGINVTTYLDSWLPEGQRSQNRAVLLDAITEGVASFCSQITESGEATPQVVFFSTQPMDEALTKDLAGRLKAPMIDNSRFLSHDIQAAMALCQLFVGMRFHSLVLSSAVGAPIVGLIYAPKVAGLFDDLETPELALSMRTLTAESFAQKLKESWQRRAEIKQKQQARVQEFCQGAHKAFRLVVEALK